MCLPGSGIKQEQPQLTAAPVTPEVPVRATEAAPSAAPKVAAAPARKTSGTGLSIPTY